MKMFLDEKEFEKISLEKRGSSLEEFPNNNSSSVSSGGSSFGFEEEFEDEFEEEFEDEEISESELLVYLDKLEDPYSIVSCIFKEKDAKGKHEKFEIFQSETMDTLLKNGFVVLENQISMQKAISMRDETVSRVQAGRLTAAHQFDPEDPERDLNTRDDLTCMLNNLNDGNLEFLEYFCWLKRVKRDLDLFLHLKPDFIEYQLAYYPGHNSSSSTGGARYERHRDSFPDRGDDPDHPLRKVTVILYLGGGEDCWTRENGGCLKIYHHNSEDFTLVQPERCRAVVFLSGLIDHEVLPVFGDYRIALTAWIH